MTESASYAIEPRFREIDGLSTRFAETDARAGPPTSPRRRRCTRLRSVWPCPGTASTTARTLTSRSVTRTPGMAAEQSGGKLPT